MVLRPRLAPSSRSARPRVGAHALCGWIPLALALLGTPAAHAAPVEDDWSVERSAADPALVQQRFDKLRKQPFDTAQWRALEAVLGKAGLAKKIEAGLSRTPGDLSLGILDARAKLALGDPRGAAARLAEVETKAGGLRSRVFKLRIEALQAAGDARGAVAALEAAAQTNNDDALRLQALDIADRHQLGPEGLRLAQALAARDPNNGAAQLRLARMAARAGQAATAEAAYAKAVAHLRGGDQLGAREEWARARIGSGDAAGAGELAWAQVEATRVGSPERAAAWDLVLEAGARQAGGDTPARIEKFLARADQARDGAGWRALARAQAAGGADPVDAWRRALAADPDDPEARAALVMSLESGGEADAALAEFAKLGPKSPERLQLGLELAARLIGTGKRELGLKVAAELEASASAQGDALLRLLDFYNLQDEPDHALAIAQRLVRARPRDPDARVALGEQLFQMNREPDAMKEWALLPSLVRPAHAGWARHAEILAEHRRPEAVLSLQKALAAAPREPKYLRLRAILETDDRLPHQALATWQQVFDLTRAPEHRILHDEARTRIVDVLVGGTLSQFTSRRQAIEKQALLDLDGKDTDLAYEAGLLLAEIYTREEKYGKAVAVHEKLVRLRPQDPERLAELALALRRAGRGDAAMDALERMMTLDPKRSADVLAELAEVAFESGDIERVLLAAAHAELDKADSARVLIRIGELYERRGEPEQASKLYEGLLQRDPTNAPARLRLAELELARGRPERAEAMLREIVEKGGAPEVVEQAGRRALDLAETRGAIAPILDLALARARRDPSADEGRGLLLDALDRASTSAIKAWLASGDEPERTARTGALRRSLVEALARGPVTGRLRAAEHLGRLALPQTALPLARMGAQLTPPRDATRTVRTAFEQARAAAIQAAGALDEPEAVPVFADLLRTADASRESWYAAAWALARSSAPAAATELRRFAAPEHEGLMIALACASLARGGDLADRERVARLAAAASSQQARRVCAFARAALTSDDQLARVSADLNASDPIVAAIAAWRFGQIRRDAAREDAVTTLLARYIGPRGLPRDAAGAALGRLLAPTPARVELPPLPPLRAGSWEIAIDRWLAQAIAPPVEALPASVLRPHTAALQQALTAASAGTRAEAWSQDRLRCPCGASGERDCLDLRPLIREPVPAPRGPVAR
ncbi:tetratricopeptide repeat protein [Nannocystis sp. SCPEA4]|uniref:tetratricopeptide repeat protein n=1 Tax=Nannocystis sp. SCPEA4 TaxID=2996787 RepID=UPI00226F50CA|nr:tetratricopeptide repeat protein [Nannocystis sp. SCPEA4]MCY1062849.1 tetratricopeptide repeat protein [Nannocystis sp. SCPEA4]